MSINSEDDTNTYYKYDKHMFTVDGLDRSNRVVKEFNGCYVHGCPTCFPECKAKYNKTMERKNLLELAGYKVETMWGCEWDQIKKGMPNKRKLKSKPENKTLELVML